MLYTGTPEAYLTVLLCSRDSGNALPHLSGDEIEEMLIRIGASVQPISVSELEQVDNNLDKYRICIQCRSGLDAHSLGSVLGRHYLEGPEAKSSLSPAPETGWTLGFRQKSQNERMMK